MSYSIYANDQHIDDITTSRGMLDLHAALSTEEPEHPLLELVETGELNLPENAEEQVDVFTSLQRLDLHVGEPVDSIIAQLLQSLRVAFGHAPRTITISDGLGDPDPQPPAPPPEQDMSRTEE